MRSCQHLDKATDNMLDSIESALKDRLIGTPVFWKNPEFRLAINATSFRTLWKDGHLYDGQEDFDRHLELPEVTELVDTVRAEFPDSCWPVMIDMKLGGADRGHRRSDKIDWITIEISRVGLAGCMPRSATFGGRGYSSRRWGKNDENSPLSDLLDEARLIDRFIPASNQPVKAWSFGSNLMGSHISSFGIHAKTEAEAIVKKLWFMGQTGLLRDLAETGKMDRPEWLTRTWFVSEELDDLDLNPMGVRRKGDFAMDAIENAFRENCPDDGPTP